MSMRTWQYGWSWCVLPHPAPSQAPRAERRRYVRNKGRKPNVDVKRLARVGGTAEQRVARAVEKRQKAMEVAA